MRKPFDLTVGKILLAISFFAIGIIHLITGHFPIGLIPVPVVFPGKNMLVYLTGFLMLLSVFFMSVKKYRYYGVLLAGAIYALVLLLAHVPKVLENIYNASEWTGFFEVVAILSGILILIGVQQPQKNSTFIRSGQLIFAAALIVFGILHCMYAQFIVTLIAAWLPAHFVFNYLVIFAFFSSAFSIIIQRFTKLSTLLLSLMFMVWFIILHLPRAIANYQIEPEWTSAFIALAFSGIALIVRSTSV